MQTRLLAEKLRALSNDFLLSPDQQAIALEGSRRLLALDAALRGEAVVTRKPDGSGWVGPKGMEIGG
jgi:hypothetical protein